MALAVSFVLDWDFMKFDEQTVFVYGTLKPGGRYWPRFCEGKVSCVVPARIRGELYDLGVGYPAYLERGKGWVEGCVLTFQRAEDFARVDWLEGYSPTRPPEENEYQRIKVPCFDTREEPLGHVWAYAMSEVAIQHHRARRIEDGNWPVGREG